MAQVTGDVSPTFKETYRDIVPELYETTDMLHSKVKSKNVEKASARGLRLSKKVSPGGQFRTFAQDGGDLGRGSAPKYDAGTVTPLPFAEAIEINKSIAWNSATTTLAVLNLTSSAVSDAMDELNSNLDKTYCGSGDGVMATVNVSGTAYTATTAFRARRIRALSFYQQYDTTLATNRGRVGVTTVPDDTAGTFTVDVAPGGSTSGDKLLVDGLSGASPTWINGIYNLHSSSSSGTINGLSRSTYSQLRAPEIVCSSAITQGQLRAGINAVDILRSDPFSSGTWALIGHQAQRQAIEEIAFPMMIFNKDQSGGGSFDPLLDDSKLKVAGKFKYIASRNMDPTRVDLINFDNWGRGETLPVGMYSVDDDTIFPIYGASGGLAAAQIFYIVGVHQTFVDDYQLCSIWSSLTVPNGSASLYFN
jgi:hypothetical protein